MVSTTEGFIDNSPIVPGPYIISKQPIARKSLLQFTEVLYVKWKTSFHKSAAAKSEHKAIREGIILWSSIPNRRGHTKINEWVNNIFIIGCYSILRLCNTQFTMIVLNYLFVVTINHSWFQNCHCNIMSEK